MHDELERLRADEDSIAPSAGFLGSVMEAVEREAAAQRPLEFPWSRALPGLLATAAALGVALWRGIGSLNDPAFDEEVRQLLALATGAGLHWLSLAVAITILSVTLPLALTPKAHGALA